MSDSDRLVKIKRSGWTSTLASFCLHCAVCKRARQRQGGLAFRIVLLVEERLCPFCRAYASFYGRKAHEPLPELDPQVGANGAFVP